MRHRVRVLQNHVKCGKLYSVKTWERSKVIDDLIPPQPGTHKVNLGLLHRSEGRVHVSREMPNSVNLGRLYAPMTLDGRKGQPCGWAYFEDGSVYINSGPCLSHTKFEAWMKLAAHCLRKPTPKQQQQAIIHSERQSQRLFILSKFKAGHSVDYFIRNVHDGEDGKGSSAPFRIVTLTPDGTGTSPMSLDFGETRNLLPHYRIRLGNALKIFRGTLIDGVLQPNVRLGNGLRITDDAFRYVKPPRRKAESVQKWDEQRSRMNADSERKYSSYHPRLSSLVTSDQSPDYSCRQLVIYAPTTRNTQAAFKDDKPVFNMKRDLLEAKERELKQKEEASRWKRKAWLLEQKLAEKTGSSGPRSRDRSTREPREPEHHSEHDWESAPGQQADPDSFSDLADDISTLEGFNVEDPVAPQSLARLRSLIVLPSKGTLHTKRGSKPN